MFNFQLEEQEANLILQALSELPLKTSINLVQKIQQQAQAQAQVQQQNQMPSEGLQSTSNTADKKIKPEEKKIKTEGIHQIK